MIRLWLIGDLCLPLHAAAGLVLDLPCRLHNPAGREREPLVVAGADGAARARHVHAVQLPHISLDPVAAMGGWGCGF